jgi:heme/copper-type cytochrome/quinol oxidase subunit 2
MIATIDWGALGQAVWTSVVIGLGVLIVAALAVVTSLRSQDARNYGRGSAAASYAAITTLCVIALAAAIVVGIYIMTDK